MVAPEPRRVPCPPGTTVVGDLHLDPFDEGQQAPVVDWLEGLAGIPRLVVLGDLFEFWVGPKGERLEGARALCAALRRRVEGGTAVDVLHGNRDFLLDGSFERASGAVVHPAGLLGEHEGERTLFLHGDELCTGDRAYQRFKRFARARPTRWLALHLPFPLQRRLARSLRRASVRAVSAKPDPVKAMRVGVADARAREAGADALVCGHAHRFRDELLPGGARWLVIDGWGGGRDALRLEAGGWRPFHALDPAPPSGKPVGGPVGDPEGDNGAG